MDSFDEIEYLEKTVENPDKDSENNGRAVDDEDRDSRRHSRRRSDEADHHSKRARSESRHEKERDRDRDRSRRGSSHHRSSPDGRDRHRSSERRERERSERNGRETERDRKESDRDREKSKDRERSRRSRSRSERRKSPDRHRESRDRDLLRERERERELREKERRFKERKEENAEPEADPERDQRTVFAYQICLRADERNVYEFFSRAGKVRDVRLIMDRNSRRSKGVGYIEFYDAMSVPMAIALSGQLLLGQPVMVKPSEAEKNLVQSSAGAAGAVGGVVGPYSGGARRLYVGNLHFNMTEDQLRQVFEPFGPVELVQLPTDPETGQCKGFGFVQFAKLEDARSALNLNGNLEIAGRTLKVSAVTDQAGMQEFGANAADFDDDDGGGISLNARSRVLLMQKLDRSNTPSSVSAPAVSLPGPSLPASLPPAVAQTAVPAVPAYIGGLVNPAVPAAPVTASAIGTPSECLLLINMFDPKTETEPDFDLDIKDDVQDECAKFGTVRHIFVDKNSAGHVYLRFDTVTSAKAAQLALHGRWFAGKMITATYMPIPTYEAKFPDSRL